jgi:hypothetical protein
VSPEKQQGRPRLSGPASRVVSGPGLGLRLHLNLERRPLDESGRVHSISAASGGLEVQTVDEDTGGGSIINLTCVSRRFQLAVGLNDLNNIFCIHQSFLFQHQRSFSARPI